MTDEDDEFSEDEAEISAGVTDSMLTPPDFVHDSERQHILRKHTSQCFIQETDLSVFSKINIQRNLLTQEYFSVNNDQKTKIVY